MPFFMATLMRRCICILLQAILRHFLDRFAGYNGLCMGLNKLLGNEL